MYCIYWYIYIYKEIIGHWSLLMVMHFLQVVFVSSTLMMIHDTKTGAQTLQISSAKFLSELKHPSARSVLVLRPLQGKYIRLYGFLHDAQSLI